MDFNKFANQCASEHSMEIAREGYMRDFRRRMITDKVSGLMTKEQLSFLLKSMDKKDIK